MLSVKYNGETKTAEVWGIREVVRQRVSLARSTLTFEVTAELGEAELFPYGATVIFYQDLGAGPVQWFVGRVDQTPRTATGRYQSYGYVLVCPWWYLETLVYQIGWKELANPLEPSQGTIEKLYSHLILNLDPSGTFFTTKEQVTRVLNYCKEAGAPFEVGTIDLPDVFPPTSEVIDTTCGEVIRKQLRWTPGAVGWVDHSQTPPTINIVERSKLTRYTAAKNTWSNLRAVPRYDLQATSVVLKYRRTNMVNGVAYPEQHIDAAPPGATGKEFGSLASTIDMEGTQINYSTTEIVCAPIQHTTAAWWKGQYTPFSEAAVANLQIANATRESNLPRELVSGSIPGWLLQSRNAKAERDTVKASATYDQVEGEVVSEKRVGRPVHTEIIATDLNSGTYLSELSVSFGQAPPIGVANYLYTEMSKLHFDGSVDLQEEECSGAVGIGNVLCIAGDKAEYVTMDAVVQTVTETIGDGRTTIQFGPPRHLQLSEIMEFLASTKNRVRYTPIAALSSGISGRASASPKETPKKNSNSDGGTVDKFTVGGSIVIAREHNPENRGVQLREYPIAIKNADGVCEQWYFKALGSEPYKK
ncbi:MAG TPA: hypothetical protein VF773_10935 [Verrucomicrobiae bacterium]